MSECLCKKGFGSRSWLGKLGVKGLGELGVILPEDRKFKHWLGLLYASLARVCVHVVVVEYFYRFSEPMRRRGGTERTGKRSTCCKPREVAEDKDTHTHVT